MQEEAANIADASDNDTESESDINVDDLDETEHVFCFTCGQTRCCHLPIFTEVPPALPERKSLASSVGWDGYMSWQAGPLVWNGSKKVWSCLPLHAEEENRDKQGSNEQNFQEEARDGFSYSDVLTARSRSSMSLDDLLQMHTSFNTERVAESLQDETKTRSRRERTPQPVSVESHESSSSILQGVLLGFPLTIPVGEYREHGQNFSRGTSNDLATTREKAGVGLVLESLPNGEIVVRKKIPGLSLFPTNI